MSTNDTGGAAFPLPVNDQATIRDSDLPWDTGLTIQDWFAGQILPAIFANEPEVPPNVAVGRAYEYADAMIRERRNV